jgi:hypothetical protein
VAVDIRRRCLVHGLRPVILEVLWDYDAEDGSFLGWLRTAGCFDSDGRYCSNIRAYLS